MKLEIYEDAAGFETLRGEWNTLLQQSATNTLFLTWEWQKAWWEAFGQGKDLRLITVRGADGVLLAVLPLFLQETVVDLSAPMPDISVEHPVAMAGGEAQQTAHLVGGTEVSDYLDIIAPAEWNREAYAAILDALDGLQWQILDLRCLPAHSPTVPAVSELSTARGWSAQQAREDVCPVVELPGTWDEYLAGLNKKQRHELRRKMRRAEAEAHVEWRWITADTLDDGLATFFRLHKGSDPGKAEFMDRQMEGFFRAIAYAALDNGWLRLSELRFNGQPVASYLCFDYGTDRLVYNSGFDLSSYADLGPGIVSVGYMIQDAIAHGLKRFDFLQGDERYKYEFGAHDTEVLRLLVRR